MNNLDKLKKIAESPNPKSWAVHNNLPRLLEIIQNQKKALKQIVFGSPQAREKEIETGIVEITWESEIANGALTRTTRLIEEMEL